MKTNPSDAELVVTKTDNYISKREYFAGLAMQGLQAANIENGIQPVRDFEIIAVWAVNQADALIEELNKEK